MAAQVPIDVPTMRRVTGMSATSRMMKGTERKPLMTAPSKRLSQRFSAMPPRPLATSASPSGRPKTSEMMPEAAVITMVSQSERKRSSSMIGDMAEDLHLCAETLCIGRKRRGLVGRHREKEAADGLLLDVIDAAVDQAVATGKL